MMWFSRVIFLRALLGLALGPLVIAAACAQTAPSTTIIEPPAPLLPTSADLQPVTSSAIPDETPDINAILQEDGIVRRDARTLTAPKGSVIAYQFGDATGAYSAFTSFAAGGKPLNANGTPIAAADPSANPGRQEVRTPTGELLLLSGVSVVRILSSARPEALAPIVRAIDIALPKVGGRRGLAPLLPTMLPTNGLEPASIRYAVGPRSYATMGGILPASLLDWSKSTEVITARYTGGGILTLLLYPTPQIAGNTGRDIEKAINQIGPSHFGTVKLRRLGPLLILSSGSFTPERAHALVESVTLNQIITFDKKLPLQFHAEVQKTASLLQNIAVLTGVLVSAAVLLGLFLGGARAGIRVLQGKPAASEPEFLTINLRDSPKSLFVAKDPAPPNQTV
jgi:hypothetical protein